jgi:hypothetical protein
MGAGAGIMTMDFWTMDFWFQTCNVTKNLTVYTQFNR